MKSFPVRRLSAIVSRVATELRHRFGMTRMAIGGGSAPALLDHIFGGAALRMRDLDLVVIADRVVEEDLIRDIGRSLDGAELRFLPKYVYPRYRSRCEKELWVAGWGLLWDAEGIETDLSVFHDSAALSLNGLMNVDRILIPVGADKSLNEVVASMMTAGSPGAALCAGLFEDPWGGYASWIQRNPAIVAWNAVHNAPIECSIRVIRACANKLHLNQLHPQLRDPLRAAILRGRDRGDRFLRVRNLVKLFHDDRAAVELEMMHALGAFEHWLPEIGQLIEKLGHGGLVAMFVNADRQGRKDANHHAAFVEAGEQGADETSALRLEAMLLMMSPEKRQRVLHEIAVAEPLFASLVQKQMPHVHRRGLRHVLRRSFGPRRVAQAT